MMYGIRECHASIVEECRLLIRTTERAGLGPKKLMSLGRLANVLLAYHFELRFSINYFMALHHPTFM